MLVRLVRPSARSVTRTLLWCGACAGPVFTVVFSGEGRRRAGYDPRRHPISCLALGPRGWLQTANFAAAGALTVAGATGLARTREPRTGAGAVPALVAAAGAGLMVSGVFRTDPVNGYPPGTPDQVTPATPESVKHSLAAVPVFVGLSVAALLSAQASRRDGARLWAVFSGASAVGALLNVVLASAGFGGSNRFTEHAGTHQRAAIGGLLGWLTATCWKALRSPR